MKNKRRKRGPSIHPKYIYIFMSILCALLVVLSFRFSAQFSGFKSTVGDFIAPMQSGINKVGKYISDKMGRSQTSIIMRIGKLEENHEAKTQSRNSPNHRIGFK